MRRHRTYISFEPDQIPNMDKLAKKLGGIDRSDLVRLAIAEFLKKNENLLEDE